MEDHLRDDMFINALVILTEPKNMRSSYQLPELLYRKENDQGSLQPAGLFLEENSNAPEPAFINRSSKHSTLRFYIWALRFWMNG
jgi:hypothetical protein